MTTPVAKLDANLRATYTASAGPEANKGVFDMGMGGGGTGGAVSEINVTPLIDVLLVLLIIFMVIVPVTPKGLDALVPQPPKNKTQTRRTTARSWCRSHRNGGGEPGYKINDRTSPRTAWRPKLTKIFATRQEKVMFVKGDRSWTSARSRK